LQEPCQYIMLRYFCAGIDAPTSPAGTWLAGRCAVWYEQEVSDR